MQTQKLSINKKTILFFFFLYSLPVLFLFAVVVVCLQQDIAIAMFTRDPSTIADIHPFVGIVSNLGVILWTASATICLYSWSILRYSPGAKENAAFLLYSGLVTTILLLDDFFLLHEELFPLYLGMSEKIFYVGYAGLILYGMVKFKRCTLKTEYVLLLIALLFFGLSVVTDSFQHHLEVFAGDWRILFEDGFKLLGIVSWLGYFFRFSSLAIRESNGRH